MSIILGIAELRGAEVTPDDLAHLARRTQRWALDGTVSRFSAGVGMSFQPYHTHRRSFLEGQPRADTLGNMVCLDGRIDNYEELSVELGLDRERTSDSEIILAAFARWGEEALSRLIGDWSVALWEQRNRCLWLARDHAGTRTLYFTAQNDRVCWATYLDALIAREDRPAADISFARSYIVGRPAGERTPFETILAVKAAQVVRFSPGGWVQRMYWLPSAGREIRYNGDTQYDEHFLHLFRQSVKRRTSDQSTVLAHLSGGVDSSSIVCIADDVRRQSARNDLAELDTISFFDETEPSWDERPYFTAVEQHRGKAGIHIDVSKARPTFLTPEIAAETIPLFPGYDSGAHENELRLEHALKSGTYRAVLSGLGGDELLGGVASPLPELSDHLFSAHLIRLLRRGVSWSVSVRKPLVHLLGESIRFCIDAYRREPFEHIEVPWLRGGLKTYADRAEGRPPQCPGLHTPSQLVTEAAWFRLLQTLPNPELCIGERREYRFPYLDRDLVEFLVALPNEQLVQPGRRRYMMRRALSGLVPATILERRRKAYITRAPTDTIATSVAAMRERMRTSQLVQTGWIDFSLFNQCLDETVTRRSQQWASALMRTCLFELWLTSGVASVGS